jgi:hypothetical protein
MAKLNKAQISFKQEEKYHHGNEEVTTTLRFHSVIAEDHSISSDITKFPVQTGFNISNHAIRRNRIVSITGVISNHLVVGSQEFHQYGGNNSRVMFETLEGLVRLATVCDVVTNYGNYTNVVFTKFKTKLSEGKTDVMEFTITGEEIQLASTIIGETPTLLVFTALSEPKRVARIAALNEIGLDVPEDAVISEATCDMSRSFQTQVRGTNSKPVTVTYDRSAYDVTTERFSYVVNTSDTDLVVAEESDNINWFSLLKDGADMTEGALTAGACLKDGLIGLGTEIVNDTINTALGELKQTVYGAAYGVFGVNGDRSFGQVLLTIGVDCLVAGAIGTVDPNLNPDDYTDYDLPTVDEVLLGAAKTGDRVSTIGLRATAPTTITKISNTSSVNYLENLFR